MGWESSAALQLGANQPVEGEYADLFGRLSPLDFGPDLARLQRDFTGREWLQDEVRTWLAEPDGPRVFLLTGDPGAGKSAAMAYLARQLPNVAALHLCRANDAQTLDPSRFVRSLAAQLAAQIPSYASALRGGLHDPDALNVEAGSLFKNLVVNPLAAAVPDAEQTPVLVLVDGLDEALQGAADPAIPALLGSYQAEFAAYGDRVRFVLGTRDVPGVLRYFGSRSRRIRIEAAAAENRADLRAFLDRVLTERAVRERLEKAGTHAETVARWLEEKADGNFLYAEQAVLGIRDGVFDPSTPAIFPSGIVGLYQQFFARAFPDYSAYETRVRPLLDVLVAARESVSAEEIAGALVAGGRVEAAGLDPLDPTLEVRKRLKAVAALFPEREGRYAPYHASVAEWLTGKVDDEGDTLEYTVSLKTGHNLLVRAGLNAWQSEGATLPPYHIRYLPGHLLAAERWDELYGLLTTLAYLEAKAGAGLVVDLARDFQSAHAAYPAERPERFILRLLGRALEYETAFLMRHPECVFQVLWNRGWWYDAPQAAHCFEVAGADGNYTPPWARPGPKVHALLERWREERKVQGRSAPWIRCMLPPADLYAVAQVVLRGHESLVNHVAWSPDGTRLASASSDGTVRVWQRVGGVPVVLGIPSLFSAVYDVAWSPDGTRLASSYRDIYGYVTVRLWRAEGGEEHVILSNADQDPIDPTRQGRPLHLAWSPGGSFLAAPFGDGTVRVWSVDMPDKPVILSAPEGVAVQPVSRLVWSPDGGFLAGVTHDGTVRMWPSDWRSDPLLLSGHGQDFKAGHVVWSPNGERLAGIVEHAICVWRPGNQTGSVVLQGHTGAVEHIAWSPDGDLLASASNDGTVRLWSVEAGQEFAVLRGHGSWVEHVAWAPDGKHLASASLDATVRVWTPEGRDEVLVLQGHTGAVEHIAWSPDGCYLASASSDSTVRIWRVGEQAEPLAFSSHSDRIVSMAWSPDGTRLASGSSDEAVRVWVTDEEGMARGLVVLSGLEGVVFSVAWSPDGQRLAACGSGKTVCVWAADGRGEPVVFYAGDLGAQDLAWSPDGRRLAAASPDRLVRVWEPDRKGEPLVLRGDEGTFYGATGQRLAWSPDGTRLACSSWDKTVRVWQLDEHGAPLVLPHSDRVTEVVWSPDGTLLCTATDAEVRVWHSTGGDLIERRNSRPRTLHELFQPPRFFFSQATGETQVKRTTDGGPVAHLEVSDLVDVTPNPGSSGNEPIWAAASGSNVVIIRLEGVED